MTGPCAICGAVKKLSQDHDHATGRCRDKVCQRCNSALAWFEQHEVRIVAYINAPQGEPMADYRRRYNTAWYRRKRAALAGA